MASIKLHNYFVNDEEFLPPPLQADGHVTMRYSNHVHSSRFQTETVHKYVRLLGLTKATAVVPTVRLRTHHNVEHKVPHGVLCTSLS